MKPHTDHFKVSVVLADVDGTLLTQDKILTPRAKAAVASLRAAGHRLRHHQWETAPGMKVIIDDLNVDTIIAGFNGGLFVKPDFTVVLSRFVSRGAAAVRWD